MDILVSRVQMPCAVVMPFTVQRAHAINLEYGEDDAHAGSGLYGHALN